MEPKSRWEDVPEAQVERRVRQLAKGLVDAAMKRELHRKALLPRK